MQIQFPISKRRKAARIASTATFVAIAAALSGAAILPAAATPYKSLHDFYAYPDGTAPYAGLILASDGNYYGVTQSGGNYGLGAIIKITPAGVFSVPYSFPGFPGPGLVSGALTEGHDGALYGSTSYGGTLDNGVIYRFDVQTRAVTFTSLTFTAGFEGLSTLVTGTSGALYGLLNGGSAVRYQPGGSVSVVHNFSLSEGITAFNAEPITAGPDGYIYGIMNVGGANNLGTIFKMSQGGGVIKLRDLSAADGNRSIGPPAIARDNTIWGAFYGGGPNIGGTIFKMGTNGKGFTVVHSFGLGESNNIVGRLLQAPDDRFYGCVAGYYGNYVFSVGADGLYKVIHTITPLEGVGANSGFIQGPDGLLYGTAQAGGQSNAGTVFRVSTAGQFTTMKSLRSVDGANLAGAPVVASDGNYYGAATSGGANNLGEIYRTTPAGVTTTIHSFTSEEGGAPTALALGPDGQIYGTTTINRQDVSMVFRVSLSGVITPIHMFSGDASHRLTLAYDGQFYASTFFMVYRISTSGIVTKLAAIPNQIPIENVVRAGDGKVYFVSYYTGPYSPGEPSLQIYQVTAGGLTTVHDFHLYILGKLPLHLIVGHDGNLYGAQGTSIFRYTVGNGIYKDLYTFSDSGKYTFNDIAIKKDGTIYGIAANPDQSNMLYSLSATGVYTELAAIPATRYSGTYPNAELAVKLDDTLYGSWDIAGAHGNGSLFKFAGF